MTRTSNRNRALILSLLLSACSGTALHIAGHGGAPKPIGCLAVVHTAAGLAFAAAAIRHMTARRNWYRALITGAPGKRSILTGVLSAAFALALLTGIASLFADEPRTPAGLWHYRTAIVMCACGIAHLYKRLRRRTPRR